MVAGKNNFSFENLPRILDFAMLLLFSARASESYVINLPVLQKSAFVEMCNVKICWIGPLS